MGFHFLFFTYGFSIFYLVLYYLRLLRKGALDVLTLLGGILRALQHSDAILGHLFLGRDHVLLCRLIPVHRHDVVIVSELEFPGVSESAVT